MATVNIRLKFGEPAQETSLIAFQAILQMEQIESHYQELSQRINKYALPLVVFEMPQSAAVLPLPKQISEALTPDEFSEEHLQKDGKFFRLYSLKAPHVVGLIQKVEKIFKEITSLQSNLSLRAYLSDVDSFPQHLKAKTLDFFTLLLSNAEIRGEVDLPGRFIETVGLLLSKISPGFSESPIIAFLQLFEGLEINAEFDSPSILHQKTRQLLTQQILEIQLPDDDEQGQKITELLAIKEPSYIYIHFRKLGFIRIEFQTRMLGYLHCLAL